MARARLSAFRRARCQLARIKRPAKMFARMTKSHAHAVMRADLVIEAADKGELLRQRRRLLRAAALELPTDLAGKPRPSLRAAADHDAVGAGSCNASIAVANR